MSGVIQRRPRHQVLVNGGTAGPGDLVWPERDQAAALGTRFLDISDYILRIRTVKTLESPNGTFELACTFRPVPELGGRSLNRILLPDNAVLISLDRGETGSDLDEVMLGFVKRVGEKTTVDDRGRVAREITIQGEDAGKFLVRHQLPGYLLSGFLWGDAEAARRLADGVVIAGPPGKTLRQVFDLTFKNLVTSPIAVAQGITLVIDPRLDDETKSFVKVESVWLHNGKWWNIFRGLADEPWNELFADHTTLQPDGSHSGEAQYKIVARHSPFDEADWNRLHTTVIPDDAIVLQETALADHERQNLVMAGPSGVIRATADVNLDALIFKTVQADRDSMRRHGTQGATARTVYSDLAGESHDSVAAQGEAAAGEGSIMDALRERAAQLWRWNSVNHRLHSGTWVVAGNPSIGIGERVQNQTGGSGFFDEHEYERRVFYVEKVIQDYVDGSHFFTHLALTRGQPIGQFVAAQKAETS